MQDQALQGKIIHRFFEATILMKGFNGLWEIIVGVLFLFFKKETIHAAILVLANQEFIREGEDLASHYIKNQANTFSASIQYFIATYLLFYGVVNIFLVVSLLYGKLWAYPLAITLFTLFGLYQGYRWYTHGSTLLLFFIIFDAVLITLTFLEYQRVKKTRQLHM